MKEIISTLYRPFSATLYMHVLHIYVRTFSVPYTEKIWNHLSCREARTLSLTPPVSGEVTLIPFPL